MAPQNQKFEYFFDLPPELRELILSHICIFPTGILVGGSADGRCVALSPGATGVTQHQQQHPHHGSTNHNHTNGGYDYDYDDDEEEEQDYADPPTNLFLASPILHRDAADLYYTRNTFHLSFLTPSSSGRKRTRHRHLRHQQTRGQNSTPTPNPGSSSSSDPGTAALLHLLTHPDTTPARRRIRSAVIAIRRVGAQVQDVLVPALADMVLAGSLRRLRVDVVGQKKPPPPPPPRAPWMAMARGGDGDLHEGGNSALRALLVLLADPGLDHGAGGGGKGGVGLRVLRGRHAPFWCRFHEQPPSGGVGVGAVRPGVVVCPMLGARSPSLPPLSPAAAAAAAAVQRNEGGVGDGFLEVDIGRLMAAVCAGDAAEFNIKKV